MSARCSKLRARPVAAARINGRQNQTGRNRLPLHRQADAVVAIDATGDETFPGTDLTAPYFTAVRDALDHWQRGAPPPISVHDCARMVRLIDQAYARAA
jgi:hypothetical protein